MRSVFLQILIISYASVGFLTIVGYLPTIKDLYQRKQSANIMSYVIWTVASSIALLYSLFISSDMLFQFIANINFICSVIVLWLSIKFGRLVS